jgi:hypothetical protein
MTRHADPVCYSRVSGAARKNASSTGVQDGLVVDRIDHRPLLVREHRAQRGAGQEHADMQRAPCQVAWARFDPIWHSAPSLVCIGNKRTFSACKLAPIRQKYCISIQSFRAVQYRTAVGLMSRRVFDVLFPRDKIECAAFD